MEKYEGDPGSGRPAQCVTKTGNDFCRCLFSPILSSSTRHSHPLHSHCQRHHLPHVQMRAGCGFFFSSFDASTMTTTSLASNCEPGVVLSSVSTCLPPPPPPSHPNASWRWIFSTFSTRLPPPPPPSHPIASWRWIFSTFQRVYLRHHLPHVQTRAGGGSFICFDRPTTTTTSLASKRELEVVSSTFLMRLPPHHLPHIQMRAGGGFLDCFDMPATTFSLRWHTAHTHCHLMSSSPPTPPKTTQRRRPHMSPSHPLISTRMPPKMTQRQ